MDIYYTASIAITGLTKFGVGKNINRHENVKNIHTKNNNIFFFYRAFHPIFHGGGCKQDILHDIKCDITLFMSHFRNIYIFFVIPVVCGF